MGAVTTNRLHPQQVHNNPPRQHNGADHTVSERNWATREQAADHLGVHPNTIDRWRTEGRITAYRAGPRLLRYDLTEIDQMLTATSEDNN